ncbi:GTP-binding protein Rheb isoform X1 [Acipenser ruthenus]|uniref:GTP-binding protein Rheb isoform X1 n=2 Tax=Acipenser ruthenus TaxID=7906 RepID=UPI001560E238|nr:GTP-binding protein Rheb isoform X1 [Acipenser ruthenus]
MPQPKSRKIAILGYRSVGKSSLTIQFVEGQFVDSYDPTIENTFTKMITVNGQEYHLQLVDTAGQDEYSIFPQTYSIDINGYILVYSVTSNKSFEVVKVIHEKLLDMVGKVQVPIMLVGNKKDLHMESSVCCVLCFSGSSLVKKGKLWQSPGAQPLWNHLQKRIRRRWRFSGGSFWRQRGLREEPHRGGPRARSCRACSTPRTLGEPSTGTG